MFKWPVTGEFRLKRYVAHLIQKKPKAIGLDLSNGMVFFLVQALNLKLGWGVIANLVSKQLLSANVNFESE